LTFPMFPYVVGVPALPITDNIPEFIVGIPIGGGCIVCCRGCGTDCCIGGGCCCIGGGCMGEG
jgi:hypothetical protein